MQNIKDNIRLDDIEASEVYQALDARIQNRNKETFKNNGVIKEQRAEYNQELAEMERIKELYANALRAAENVVTERQQEAQTADVQSNQNLEIKTNEDYTNNVNYALKNNGNNSTRESEQYTEKEYRDFGWARANDILNEGQNADYRSKFADAKVGRAKFAKSKSGEYIIPVSDIYDAAFEGINNVLVFAKGTIANPIITSVIEIYEYDETSLESIRRQIYEGERRGIQQTSGRLFGRYYSSDFKFQSNQQRKGSESVGDSGNNGHGKSSSGETSSTEGRVKTNFSLNDTDYQKAVENGDMATAQKMVDEAAKKAGYANMFSDNEKEYLYFMGTVYSSWKKRVDYIKYFGN